MRPCSRFAAFPVFAFSAAVLFCGGTASVAQNSDVNLALHANSHASAADIGVPAYPGAKIFKNPDSDSSVDLGFSFGDTSFRVMAASYVTGDSPAQVLAFYRKPLSRYGEVLECDHGKAVGALAVARSGLTCSDQKGDHMQVDSHVDSSTDHELRVGTPNRFRIVGIDESHTGSTRFGLVYIELPKDKDSDEKSK
jgi:hypothetical protein